MKIDYQETTSDLLARIDIHSKYGSRDIDQWMLDIIQLKKGSKILDVGCGAGKQCFLYSDYTHQKAEILGSDFSEELLDKARQKLAERGDPNITFQFQDFNQKFPFDGATFDILSSAFAIYYASDLKFTFSEAHRVLKPEGVLAVSEFMPDPDYPSRRETIRTVGEAGFTVEAVERADHARRALEVPGGDAERGHD